MQIQPGRGTVYSCPCGARGQSARPQKMPSAAAGASKTRRNRLKVLTLIVSTAAYFIASHYIKRYLDEMQAPPGFTRSLLTFCAAVLIAYGVAFAVDWAEGLTEKHAAGPQSRLAAAAPAVTTYFFTYFCTRQLSVSAT